VRRDFARAIGDGLPRSHRVAAIGPNGVWGLHGTGAVAGGSDEFNAVTEIPVMEP
jgi:hypothetical protein